MPTIQEVRAKYPQYHDMSDDQLASALHQKFYSDMPEADFRAKIGLAPPQEKNVNAAPQGIMGGLKQLGGEALRSGAEAITSLPLMGADFAAGTNALLHGRTTLKPGEQFPSQRYQQTLDAAIPPPTSTAGKASELISSLLMGGKGAGRLSGASIARPTVRQMITGNTNVRQNVANQARAGITNPSPGIVADSKALRGTEALQSHLPGSAGIAERAAGRRSEGMGGAVSRVADRLAPGGASNEAAGRATTSGIDKFIEKFKAKQAELYAAVKKHIAPDKSVELPNFTSALQGFTKSVKGAEKTSASLVNSKVAQLFEDLKADTNVQVQPTQSIIQGKGGPLIKPPTATVRSMPYEAVDVVRQRIGQLLDDKLVSDYPKAQLKRLYGALTTDIENALGKGTPARKAWDRARDYTRAGRDRIDNVLEPIAGKATPEQSLKAALSGTKEGASMFRRTMRSLPVKEANTVRANVIEKMGKATPGAQDAAGGRFSMDTFVTNWNNLHADAKRVLFADPKIRADMENIAKVASEYKQAGRALYNPSGSGKVVGHAAIALESIRALLTGQFGEAAAIASTPGVNWALARAMNSPKFISWLSSAATAKPVNIMGKIEQLSILANQAKDKDEKKALTTLSKALHE